MKYCKGNYFRNIFSIIIVTFSFNTNILFAQVLHQQSDTIVTETDSTNSLVVDTVKEKIHSPRLAAIYSAVLPGLGQVYNRKYWKLPIIYAGAGISAYLIRYNYTIYNNIHKSYRYRKDLLTETHIGTFSVKTISGKLTVDLDQFSDEDLISLQNSYRRDLDLSVLLVVGIYGLNIIDAVVDAHLFNFDVSNNLSFHFTPEWMPGTAFTNSHTGLCLRVIF